MSYLLEQSHWTMLTFRRVRDKDPSKLVDDTVSIYKEVYNRKDGGPEEFWKLLMSQGDKFSVRQYLTLQ